jgi:hypothetical protein
MAEIFCIIIWAVVILLVLASALSLHTIALLSVSLIIIVKLAQAVQLTQLIDASQARGNKSIRYLFDVDNIIDASDVYYCK